jgi:ABC-2 type transport system ATP-binding protein
MEKAIIVDGLSKAYGNVTAVDDLNLEISRGETFGLLGHNGAGKSTSIECILGVKKPDKGIVEVLGMNPVTRRKELFERVGVQFQQTNYQDKITVSEICEVTHSFYRNPADWKDLLKTFGLTDMQKRLVSELSGGERQKLSVLLALIPNPELFFFDELTTGLDTKARREVWRYLEKLKLKGLTILLTSHYMDEVEALCDRICILRKGRIVEVGTVPALIHQSPYDNLEEAYLWYSGEEESENESL